MGMSQIVVTFLVSVCLLFCGIAQAATNEDGSESWGYVEVRPRAHMFWWYYKSPYRKDDPNKPWPIILWLQGGPGSSGVAIGNFEEVGPLDTNLKPRNSTWLTKADLLFVDNPVGTGFSFVEDTSLLVKTDYENAADLTTLLIKIFNRNETLQKSPLYIVAESYGGKFAVTLGSSALKAIEDGKLKLKLGGIALGDTWISPEDFVFSWGPLLKAVSRLDNNGLQKSNSLAQKIRQQLASNQFVEATNTWSELENLISSSSNSVDFYNFMLDEGMDPVSATTLSSGLHQSVALKRYSRYLNSLRASPGGDVDIDGFMNGVVKQKLKIIPKNVTWGNQANSVFNSLAGDFMKPMIKEVDELLARGVNVTIYSGQLDLICSTMGTEAWVEKLKWDGLKTFLNMDRTPLYCGGERMTKGFTKSYRNLHFYWILGAGHFVPVDQPCVTLNMISSITQNPVASK
ncbi:serine protease [Lithospermum erythrorhizon]|uniref:Carboxypeptidase n=1 Tax=Lithospermum erythrorhizon TaxID=34254 RepID=A0AAV3Q0M2_LITER